MTLLGDKESQECENQNSYILVVDDEPDLVTFYKETLESAGYKVLCATDGVEALIILKREQNRISLVLSDLTMPIMDGIELYKNIVMEFTYFPFVVLTAHEETEKLQAFLRIGVIDYIVKPIKPSDLVKKIDIWLEVARREKEEFLNEEKKSQVRMERLLRLSNA